MAFVAILLILFPAFCISQELVIHFLDVGQADAAILQCGDEVMMIDGGRSSNSSLIYSVLKNTLHVHQINYMIATHPHDDHIGGLSGALNASSVGVIDSPVTAYDSKAFSSLLKYAQKQGLIITIPKAGDTFAFGDAQVQFLSPVQEYDNMNDNSLVIRIVHGQNTFLFAGDAEWDAEHDMVSSGIDLSATVLKVGHHGSSTSSSYMFLREVMPQYAVISCGKDNSYGHPSADVLSRLRNVGAIVYRTDLQGDITCVSDGTSVQFHTQKESAPDSIWQSPDGYTLESEAPVHQEAKYIGNRNTMKFHYISCPSVNDMKESNKEELFTREEAMQKGYIPCKRCNP